MPKIRVTREDMLRSKTVKPGWYRATVKRVGEKPAKTDGSTTWPIDFTLLSEGEFQGVPVSTVFSEKAPGFAIKFIEACGGKVGPDGGEMELSRAEGKELEIFIDNDLYDGRLTNKIKDYRSIVAAGV
jgi:hypothetical protein